MHHATVNNAAITSCKLHRYGEEADTYHYFTILKNFVKSHPQRFIN